MLLSPSQMELVLTLVPGVESGIGEVEVCGKKTPFLSEDSAQQGVNRGLFGKLGQNTFQKGDGLGGLTKGDSCPGVVVEGHLVLGVAQDRILEVTGRDVEIPLAQEKVSCFSKNQGIP